MKVFMNQIIQKDRYFSRLLYCLPKHGHGQSLPGKRLAARCPVFSYFWVANGFLYFLYKAKKFFKRLGGER